MGPNNFSGSVPDEFGNLTSLQQLLSFFHIFFCDILYIFFQLHERKKHYNTNNNVISMFCSYMASSGLSGELPKTLTNLKNMKIL